MSKNLIFLHGALGTSKNWVPVIELLKDESFTIHNLDFPGHGSSSEPISGLQSLIDFLENYIQTNQLSNATIIGYSMGAYVALSALKQKVIQTPQLICIATKTLWNPTIAEAESNKLNIDNLNSVVDKLQQDNVVSLETLISNTQSILKDIGDNPISGNDISLLMTDIHFVRGEKDKMVTLEENTEFANNTRNPLITIPEQGHLLERIDKFILAETIKQLVR